MLYVTLSHNAALNFLLVWLKTVIKPTSDHLTQFYLLGHNTKCSVHNLQIPTHKISQLGFLVFIQAVGIELLVWEQVHVFNSTLLSR